MNESADAWEARVAALWDAYDDHEPDAFVAAMRALAAERPAGDAVAEFELAGAYDATGYEAEAEAHYRSALGTGLDSSRRRQATIQLASTLRNLGRAAESVALLRAERDAGSDELDDAVAGFLALSLVDSGREREAVGLALSVVAKHLPQYQRSMAAYARDLVE
ncbi:tetratricopeptide repeat protein [Yinghuangia soli]|uniref:Tetratricopeptide repeat protein n=1 Tax=Yinghuangia soli TaxID=2908204 RepID=A0AA41PX85_9ACTN|nr:tetratricopeptide repeat protein [Yinghuangia soli]MCF2526881.1 tetratricopeptide repeat protein [Yinghuangia soli]